MAGIITISPGHDASYPWRQIGTGAEPGKGRQAGPGYYLSPSEKGGEPPGHWRDARHPMAQLTMGERLTAQGRIRRAGEAARRRLELPAWAVARR